MMLLSLPILAGGGCEVVTGPSRPGYQTPRAFVDTPMGEQAGNILISYNLVDVESDYANIVVSYSTDSGVSWHSATEGPGGDGTMNLSTSSYPGLQHVYVWDSIADGINYCTTTRIRISPNDGSSASTAGESGDFTVSNSGVTGDTPVIGWFATPQGVVQQVPLTFAWKNQTPEIPIYKYFFGLDEDPPTQETVHTEVLIMPPDHGPHTFRVYAVSAGGETSNTISVNFHVSEGGANIPPSVEFVRKPEGIVTTPNVTFEWRGIDPDGAVAFYFYNLDNADWINAGQWTGTTFADLEDGDHSLSLYCMDYHGACSSVVWAYFTIDQSYVNQPPSVNITGGPSGTTADTTPTFTWSGSDPDGTVVGYYWWLDSGPETYTSLTEITLGPLGDGAYTFSVKAVDNEGLQSSAATSDFTVETGGGNLPPTVSITSGPQGNTTDTTPDFTWMGSDSDGTVAGYYWHVDSGPETFTTSTGVTLSAQADGPHTFYVKATDNDGDNSTIDSRSFTVVPPGGNNPPTVTITGGPSGNTIDNTPEFTWSGSDSDGTVAGYYWHVDAGPETYTTLTSVTLPEQAVGPHTFFVKAIDNDGDNSSEDSRAFTVEDTGPAGGDFLETFDDGTVDPDLEFMLNGAATQSVSGGTWFFDQSTSASDAHRWHYNVPLDISRPFVARVRAKTDNYIASASQECPVMFIWATPDGTFEFYSGGMCPENTIVATALGGTAYSWFYHNCPPVGPPGYNWNFVDNIWEADFASGPRALPYAAATFITMELWSTPASFYLRMHDESGTLMAETTPVNWADNPQIAAGDDIYLCGGEYYTSWWSNDEWIDFIEVDYEPDPPSEVFVFDTFGDGVLDSRFGTHSAGTCTFNENTGTGCFEIDEGTSNGDAGIVYLKDALDVTKPITIKHRTRLISGGGMHMWNIISFQQNTGYPQCADLATRQEGQLLHIGFRPGGSPILEVAYLRSDEQPMYWDIAGSTWVLGSMPMNYVTISDFHTGEFHSDGSQWYFIVRDQSGTIIIQTDTVLWSELRDTGEDYWFLWGDDCTQYTYGDGESDYIYASYTPAGDAVSIYDDFGDGVLDSRFGTHSLGTCTFNENTGAGVFEVNMGTSSGDAGIVYLKDALDVTKPMTFKHRSRVLGATGMNGWSLFTLSQNTGYPQCGSGIPNKQVILALMRAPNMPLHNGAIQIFYENAAGASMVWDETNTQWVPVTPTEPFIDVTVSDFHVAELHSDGSQWYMIIRDQAGTIIMQTTPVSWSGMYDSGDDYWFFWGEESTSYFYGDGESDYIEASYTPAGGEVTVYDDFGDGTLDSHFGTDSAGTCTFNENATSGLYEIDMGTSSADAGLVYLKDALDVSKPITIKHRVRVLGLTGMHCFYQIGIKQNPVYPICGDLSSIQARERINFELRDNLAGGVWIQIGYWDSTWNGVHWNQASGTWGAPGTGWTVVDGDFHLAEFHSDGAEWYIIVRDQAGSIIIQTTPIAWSDTYDDGSNYWFIWGDDCTSYFYGDGESDYIDMTYTPK
jgi:hypothetical protein